MPALRVQIPQVYKQTKRATAAREEAVAYDNQLFDSLQAKLHAKDRELAIAKSAIKRRDAEIAELTEDRRKQDEVARRDARRLEVLQGE